MDTKQLIGAQIKELRKSRQLTQERLAEKVGINPKYLRGIERGKENPTLDTFIKVAKTLGASIEELFHQLEIENTVRQNWGLLLTHLSY